MDPSREQHSSERQVAAEGSAPLELIAYHDPARGWMRISPASRWRSWMNETEARFANRCLPLLVANEAGWLVHNPVAFKASWNGEAGVDGVTIEFDEEADPDARAVVRTHFGYGIITWFVPYLFRTPPGWNLLARGPANSPKDGVGALEGLVETDWSVAPFTMNWKLTRVDHPVTFEADEPVCMVVPQRRGELRSFAPQLRDIAGDPGLEREYRRWAERRNLATVAALHAVRQGKDRAARAVWDRDYFKGQTPGGEAAPEHQTKLGLPDFERETD